MVVNFRASYTSTSHHNHYSCSLRHRNGIRVLDSSRIHLSRDVVEVCRPGRVKRDTRYNVVYMTVSQDMTETVRHKRHLLFSPTKTHFSIERITASEVTESIYFAKSTKKKEALGYYLFPFTYFISSKGQTRKVQGEEKSFFSHSLNI